jgi:hypothetical protein
MIFINHVIFRVYLCVFCLFQAPTPYKYIQFQHNEVTQVVHVYLQMQETTAVKPVLDINVKTKEIKYFNAGFKEHYVYSNRYEGLYNIIINMEPGKQATALKSLLMLVTKYNMLQHVMFCTQDYLKHYKQFNKTNEKYALVKDFVTKLSTKSLAEATIAFNQLYEVVNCLGPDRQHVDFQNKIRDIVHIINKDVLMSVTKEYNNIKKKIDKQVAALDEVLEAHNLQNIVSYCQMCKKAFTYHKHNDCNHSLCVNCGYISLCNKSCRVCDKFNNLRDNSDSEMGSDDNSDDDFEEPEKRPSPANSALNTEDENSDFYLKFGNADDRIFRPRRSSSNLSMQESQEVNEAVEIIQRNIDDNAVIADVHVPEATRPCSNVPTIHDDETNQAFDVEEAEQGNNTRDCFEQNELVIDNDADIDNSDSDNDSESDDDEEDLPIKNNNDVDINNVDTELPSINFSNDRAVNAKDDNVSDDATAVDNIVKTAETLQATETIAALAQSYPTVDHSSPLSPDEIRDALETLCGQDDLQNDIEITDAVSGIVMDTNPEVTDKTPAVATLISTLQSPENVVEEDSKPEDFLDVLNNIKIEPTGIKDSPVSYYEYELGEAGEQPNVTIKLERDDNFFAEIDAEINELLRPAATPTDDDDDDCIIVAADESAFRPKRPAIKMSRVKTMLIDETDDDAPSSKRIKIETCTQ